MYPNQKGFLIPLALILIVGISFLAIAVSRLSAQSGSQATIEGLSVQAFYAAESGAQYGVYQLFDTANSRAQADSNCGNISSGPQIVFTAPGLDLCRATVSCSRSVNAEDTISFFNISSVAGCGAGQLLGEREIEVSTYYE
ncbi:MSHA biogenesis protein MshP [Teredinibacter franksiae]|jgi:hypothetical protein|uniref:MSHA biogenesis protein MshP n=1 Tax=Teredinibacter franksiae TaxID=2761453 RepID=UPI00162433BB|nr:MSHA biogenesis protein MshP [Teredinibacter franksiae]